MECPACGDEMTMEDFPDSVWAFSIGSFEVTINRWRKRPWCSWCASERDRDREQAIIQGVEAEAYSQGYYDAKQTNTE